MLHELGKELEDALVLKGCPFKVLDREDFKPLSHRNVIVIEHDGADSFGSAKSQSVNAKRYYTRTVGAKLTIYAQSPKAGANEFEHRRRAEHALDLALVALRDVCNTRKFLPEIGRGQFIPLADLAGSDVQSGAVYELAFTFDRAVNETDFDSSIDTELTIAAGNVVDTTTSVSIETSDATAETV
jgi:hypothetical protein